MAVWNLGVAIDDGAVNDALVRLTQEKLFTVLVDLEVDPADVDIAKLAKAVAELGKASVAQKRWMAEARKGVAGRG